MAQADSNRSWSMHFNARMAGSAVVHLLHSSLVLVLTQFVPGRVGPYLKYVWGIGAVFTVLGLLLLLRIGSYAGTTDEEVGQLIRRCYWMATGTYLSLLGVSLYLMAQS